MERCEPHDDGRATAEGVRPVHAAGVPLPYDKRYIVELNGEKFEVSIDPERPGVVVVDGEERHVRIDSGAGGAVQAYVGEARASVKLGYEAGELYLEGPEGERKRVNLEDAELAQWRESVVNAPAAPPPPVPDALRSPITGSVGRLLADEGSQVQKGQPLLLLEAMKMQNQLTAPKDGVVEFAVKPGQTVRTGEVLANIR